MWKKWAVVGGILLAGNQGRAESTLDRVVTLFSHRACGGCHRAQTARESMANFTIDGGEREIMKSFAYRHWRMRDRVLKELGAKALREARYLESPSIDPHANGGRNHGSLASLANSITRDGDSVSEPEMRVLEAWFDEGAPLPRDILDEVFADLRRDLRHVLE